MLQSHKRKHKLKFCIKIVSHECGLWEVSSCHQLSINSQHQLMTVIQQLLISDYPFVNHHCGYNYNNDEYELNSKKSSRSKTG